MMKNFTILLLIVICFFKTENLYAWDCSDKKSNPLVFFHIYPKDIRYDHKKSPSEFPAKPYATTMGLTVSQFNYGITAEAKVETVGNRTCTTLSRVDFTFGFPRIDVYIDKKYKKGTCNYNVIKEHEDYHVRVQLEGLKAFENTIKKGVRIAAGNVKPVSGNNGNVNQVVSGFVKQIKADIQPLINYVDEKLKEKNAVIDTPQSYADETKKCPRW